MSRKPPFFKHLFVKAIISGLMILLITYLSLLWLNKHKYAQHTKVDNCYTQALGATAYIPGGIFTMGSEENYKEEGPVHEVTVADFDIDIHEVTNAQFTLFVKETAYVTSAERAKELGFNKNGSAVFNLGQWQFVAGANWRNPYGPDSSILGKDHHPVVHISLEDAQAYAKWAGRAIPSESQWEYAVRGGLSRKKYAWGDSFTQNEQYMANTWQGLFPVIDTVDDGYKGLAPIACFSANAYGLFDMIGNVWEWTNTAYFPQHQLSLKPDNSDNTSIIGFDPRQNGIAVGVIKGGSFLCADNYCKRYRPTARHSQDLKLGTNHIGFRTVSQPK